MEQKDSASVVKHYLICHISPVDYASWSASSQNCLCSLEKRPNKSPRWVLPVIDFVVFEFLCVEIGDFEYRGALQGWEILTVNGLRGMWIQIIVVSCTEPSDSWEICFMETSMGEKQNRSTDSYGIRVSIILERSISFASILLTLRYLAFPLSNLNF